METSKRDLYWTIIVAILILIAIVTYWLGGKGNEIVSYISFASAVVSIILALVAIFYSIVQNVKSQQNIGEMRTLVSEASHLMTDKANTLADRAMLIEGSLRQILETSAEVSSPTTPLADETFCFDASSAPPTLLLFYYYLVKCCEFKKFCDPIANATLFANRTEEPLMTQNQERVLIGFLVGTTVCLQCFWSDESILHKGDSKIEIRKVPSGFRENIRTIIDNRIKALKPDNEIRIWLESGMKKVDACVEAA